MPQVALAVGAVASVVGTGISYIQQRKEAKLTRRQQAEATRRSQRQAIRAAQIQRAQAVATAQAGGSLDSSGGKGGIGSLSSQLGSELGFSNSMSGFSSQISSARSRGATGQALAGIGGSFMNYGFSRGATLEGLFPKQQPTNPAQAMSNAPMTSLRPQLRPF